ncbi:uncharacterized protein PHALS_05397 [Plasmopara halstedii]|uniref:Uncharacterized protein n=1 Tax=Plasmopara halstedii TaxID=4781 RepID=A0A0P1AB87_PLAHL|nr:uncharacterized protein PHALS_05397 [Plasmopara halstedii]CEG37618.1 hypothetical protein PHALS_05397 [Plasmopara halstedii]|eukprot:XP_024573987.1 hypothetical protein PHALS_05397 [Plasmopara halstedii]
MIKQIPTPVQVVLMKWLMHSGGTLALSLKQLKSAFMISSTLQQVVKVWLQELFSKIMQDLLQLLSNGCLIAYSYEEREK